MKTTAVADSGHRAGLGLWLWLVALAPFFVLAAYHASWGPPPSAGDYAQYLGHARALAEGRSYGDIGYLYHPAAWGIGPPAYPPGLPTLLAPIVAFDGVHSPWLRALSLANLTLFTFVAFRRLVRDVEPWQAAFAVGLTALVIELDGGTLVPLSDPPFCALVWLLLWMADRPGEWPWKRVVGMTIVGFLALSFRVVGVVIVPALGLFALFNWRAHRGRALVPPIAWAAAGLAALGAGIIRIPYADGVMAAMNFGVSYKLHLLATQYRLALFNAELYPFAGDWSNDVYHVAATALVAVVGLVLALRIRRSAIVSFAVAYAALLFFAAGGDDRYIWPLLPLIGVTLAIGVDTAIRGIVGRGKPGLVTRGGTWMAAGSCAMLLLGALRVGLLAPRPVSTLQGPDAQGLYTWLRREQVRVPVRLVFYNPRVVALETRIAAQGILPRTAPGQLAAIDERRLSHLLWQREATSDCAQRTLNRLPALYPERFALAFANETFRVYRVIPAAAPFSGTFENVDWNDSARWCGGAR